MSGKMLARKIKQARTESGLKQSDLAERLGISTQLISAFETGRIPPDRKYLNQIATHTHKPIFFFTGQKVTEALTRVDQMIEEMKQLREILANAIESDDQEQN